MLTYNSIKRKSAKQYLNKEKKVHDQPEKDFKITTEMKMINKVGNPDLLASTADFIILK